MTFSTSYHRTINRSEPGKNSIEEFSVKVNGKTKTLACQSYQSSVLYTLWEGVHHSPNKEHVKLTDVQCMEKCISDTPCNLFAQHFLKSGYEFKDENPSR